MKKAIKIIIGILLFIIGYTLGDLKPIKLFGQIVNPYNTIGPAEYYYYIFSIFGALCTFAAVVVALFKEDILAYFKKPSLEIEESKSLKEDIDESQTPYTADALYGEITINNTGSSNAEACELHIVDIQHSPNNKKFKKYGQIKDNGHIYWNHRTNTAIDIPGKSRQTINLFKISNPSLSTPDGKASSTTEILFFGITLTKDLPKIGTWKIKYLLKVNKKALKEIDLTVTWDGVWKDRAQDIEGYEITLRSKEL